MGGRQATHAGEHEDLSGSNLRGSLVLCGQRGRYAASCCLQISVGPLAGGKRPLPALSRQPPPPLAPWGRRKGLSPLIHDCKGIAMHAGRSCRRERGRDARILAHPAAEGRCAHGPSGRQAKGEVRKTQQKVSRTNELPTANLQQTTAKAALQNRISGGGGSKESLKESVGRDDHTFKWSESLLGLASPGASKHGGELHLPSRGHAGQAIGRGGNLYPAATLRT